MSASHVPVKDRGLTVCGLEEYSLCPHERSHSCTKAGSWYDLEELRQPPCITASQHHSGGLPKLAVAINILLQRIQKDFLSLTRTDLLEVSQGNGQ